MSRTIYDLYYEAMGNIVSAEAQATPPNLLQLWILFDACSRAKDVVQDFEIRRMMREAKVGA